MPDTLPPPPDIEPPQIRALRRLVTLLTATLILGMITITGLLVWRLGFPSAPTLPAEIPLPPGQVLTGYAQGSGWVVLIAQDEEGQVVHLLRPGASEIHQSVRVRP